MRYERQIGSKVYRYFPNQQKEYLIYDFFKIIGDTVSIWIPSPINPGDTNVIIVLASGTQSVFGKIRSYMTFYNKEFPTTLYWIDQITDNIGITFSQIEPGYQLELEGAIIDSTRYGVVTNVLPTEKEIPQNLTLYQNFPNPFNSATNISYQLPVSNYVSLKVYDMLGRDVKTLFDGKQNAGAQRVNFDASNLSSGVYFYRLSAGSFVQTKKLVVLK